MTIRVAAVEFDVEYGQKEKNLALGLEMLESAGERQAQIVAMPKDFLLGSLTRETRGLSERVPGSTTEKLGRVAQKYAMYVLAGTIVEEDEGKYYSTCPLIGPDGSVLGKYRKVNLEQEEIDAGITSGVDYKVFKTKMGNFGVLIGLDMDFPEVARILALRGADVVFYLGHLTYPWLRLWESVLRTHAWLNCFYLVAANRSDKTGYCFGSSCIISPLGEIMHSTGTTYAGTSYARFAFHEGMAIGTLDLQMLDEMRKIHFIRRRKPEMYGELARS